MTDAFAVLFLAIVVFYVGIIIRVLWLRRHGAKCSNCAHLEMVVSDEGELEWMCGAGLDLEPLPAYRICGSHKLKESMSKEECTQ